MEKSIETKKVRIRFLEPMLGTVPKDPKVYHEWIESKKAERSDYEVVKNDNESATVEEIEAKGWTGFHNASLASAYGVVPEDEREKGLFIFDYMIRGFLKNAGNVLKDALKLKNVRSKIDNFVFVHPRRIYVGKTEPDGVLERPIRVMTMQGPRVALIRSDYVNAGTEIEFTLTIVPHKGDEINWEVINDLLSYGRLCGLGQFRNGSYGRFEVLWINDLEEPAKKAA